MKKALKGGNMGIRQSEPDAVGPGKCVDQTGQHSPEKGQGGTCYRTMFEKATVGSVEVDVATGRFLKVNAKYCEITGYSAEELYALTIDDITHPDDVET